MHLADLLFLCAMLATLLTIVRALWKLSRRSVDDARRIAMRWAIGAAAYFAVLFIVSLAEAGRVVPLGADECFDDWCIAVTSAERRDERMSVAIRISNRGRGRMQAEPDAYVYLRDDEGREIQPSPDAEPGTTPALGDQIAAGQSRTVIAEFDVPRGTRSPSLVKARRARFPGNIIIGDPGSLLHRPTVHVLQ